MRKWNVACMLTDGHVFSATVVAEDVSVSDSGALVFYVHQGDERGVISKMIAKGYWSEAALEEE